MSVRIDFQNRLARPAMKASMAAAFSMGMASGGHTQTVLSVEGR